jgi:hypothetical protein
MDNITCNKKGINRVNNFNSNYKICLKTVDSILANIYTEQLICMYVQNNFNASRYRQ